MPRVLIVTYDLVNPGQNYERLLDEIKAAASWAKLGGSSYLIETTESVIAVRDRLQRHLDQNDRLFVGSAPAPSAWRGLPDDVTNWIMEHQR